MTFSYLAARLLVEALKGRSSADAHLFALDRRAADRSSRFVGADSVVI